MQLCHSLRLHPFLFLDKIKGLRQKDWWREAAVEIDWSRYQFLWHIPRERSGGTIDEEIVKPGHTNLMTYPPNVKYEERFLKAYREAKDKGRGFGDSPSCGFLPETLTSLILEKDVYYSYKWKPKRCLMPDKYLKQRWFLAGGRSV